MIGSVAYWWYNALDAVYDIKRGWSSASDMSLVVSEDRLPMLAIMSSAGNNVIAWVGMEDGYWSFENPIGKSQVIKFKSDALWAETRVKLPDMHGEGKEASELLHILENVFPFLDVKQIRLGSIEVTNKHLGARYLIEGKKGSGAYSNELKWTLHKLGYDTGDKLCTMHREPMQLHDMFVSSVMFFWNEFFVLNPDMASKYVFSLFYGSGIVAEVIDSGICREYSWVTVVAAGYQQYVFIFKREGLEIRLKGNTKENLLSLSCILVNKVMEQLVKLLYTAVQDNGSLFDKSFPSLKKPKFESRIPLSQYNEITKDRPPFRVEITSPFPWIYSSWEPEPDDDDAWMYDENGKYIGGDTSDSKEEWDDLYTEVQEDSEPDEVEDVTASLEEDFPDDESFHGVASNVDKDSGMRSVDDEESPVASKFSDLDTNPIYKPLVPDGITRIRLIGLTFDGKIVAYRFKTNKGDFDLTRDALIACGYDGVKVLTVSKLEQLNGMLLTKGERIARECVPDISNCQEDLNKLFNLLFTLQS